MNYEITQTHHFICHYSYMSYSIPSPTSKACFAGKANMVYPVEESGQSKVPPKKQCNLPRHSQVVKFRSGRQSVGNIF